MLWRYFLAVVGAGGAVIAVTSSGIDAPVWVTGIYVLLAVGFFFLIGMAIDGFPTLKTTVLSFAGAVTGAPLGYFALQSAFASGDTFSGGGLAGIFVGIPAGMLVGGVVGGACGWRRDRSDAAQNEAATVAESATKER